MGVLGHCRSVTSIGSHTAKTLIFLSGCRSRICWTAEAPRRQVGQVGESRRIRRGFTEALLNALRNSSRFMAASGGWPVGT